MSTNPLKDLMAAREAVAANEQALRAARIREAHALAAVERAELAGKAPTIPAPAAPRVDRRG